jgi:DNA gyrase/topoisomerase IV subunit B
MARIRLEAHKIKGIDTKKPTTFLDDAEIVGFTNIADRNYNGYKELLITEGKSAAGTVKGVRNPKFQAIYSLLGVVKNSFEDETSDILGRESMKNLVKVLGCGVGSDFSINKLRWNHIII